MKNLKSTQVNQFLKTLFNNEEKEIKGKLHKQFLISGVQNKKLKNKLRSLRDLRKELDSLLNKSEGTLST